MVTPMQLDANHLRAAREKAGLTRQALAKKAGLSKESVKRLEVDPSASTKYETILALAQALGVPFSDLSETEVPA